jgi:hypothetical protein
MFAQAHGSPGISPAGRSPVVLHPNASHGPAPPYGAALACGQGLGSVTESNFDILPAVHGGEDVNSENDHSLRSQLSRPGQDPSPSERAHPG